MVSMEGKQRIDAQQRQHAAGLKFSNRLGAQRDQLGRVGAGGGAQQGQAADPAWRLALHLQRQHATQ